jgi:hypothetical protein
MLKNKKRNQKKKFLRELPASTLACPKGLLEAYVEYGRFELDSYTMLFRGEGAYATDGAGVNATVWSNNPSVASNWAGAAAVFDEYRVLALQIEFEPIKFNGQSIAQAPIATVVDMDTSTALTGYTLATQYSSDSLHSGGTRFTCQALMSGSADSNFVSTGSTVATYWIKSYSAGNTISSTIGRVIVTYLVQLRGKGI